MRLLSAALTQPIMQRAAKHLSGSRAACGVEDAPIFFGVRSCDQHAEKKSKRRVRACAVRLTGLLRGLRERGWPPRRGREGGYPGQRQLLARESRNRVDPPIPHLQGGRSGGTARVVNGGRSSECGHQVQSGGEIQRRLRAGSPRITPALCRRRPRRLRRARNFSGITYWNHTYVALADGGWRV